MKHFPNKKITGRFSPAAWLALLAWLLVPLFSGGCNSGLGVLSTLLDDDDEENLTAARGVSVVFEGFEDDSNRKDPREAVLRFRLRSESGGLANANISWSLDGFVFNPMSFVGPTPQSFELEEGEVFPDDPLNYPAELRGLKTSQGGRLHRIGWNAQADLGDSSLRQVTLRFESGNTLDVSVSVGNSAPVVESILSEGSNSGRLRMSVTVSDASSDPVDGEMEVSTGIENPAPEDWVQMRTVQSQRALASSPDGVAHQFDLSLIHI